MLKQFLSKLPRKSSKSDSDPLDVAGINSSNSAANFVNEIRRLNSGRSVLDGLNAVKRMSSAIFPTNMSAEIEIMNPHLSFRDVSNSEKQNLFVSKLNFCCLIPNLSDLNKNAAENNLKRQALIDLVDFVSSNSANFTEPAIAAMCKMCAINLFRAFPPKYLSGSTRGEVEDAEPIFDPSWSCIQLVYELLVRFISYSSLDAKIAKIYIDYSFVLRLLDLFESENPKERDCLKTILHRIYGKFMIHRPFIRKSVSNIIYRFVFETEKHNGIAELLEIFGSVISGFALPLKEEHRMFLWRALIPLHKPKSVGIYHQPLIYCIVQFIEKEPKLATTVIKGLLKYWPVTSSQKELMFLSELEEILEMSNMVEFQKIMVPLFRRVGCCLNSSHFQVAERAHFLLNNDHILNLVMHNRQIILPLVIPALERNTKNHWNHAVLNLTVNIRKVICDMDEELVLAYLAKYEEEKLRLSMEVEQRKLTWERLEIAAGFQPLIGGNNDMSILVQP